MKTIGLLITFCALQFISTAQDNLIIFFKDKTSNQSIDFSDLALKRRAKNNVKLDEYDLPISQLYLEEMKNVGTIMNVSRWMNAVSFKTTLSNQELLNQFPFIASIKRYSAIPKSKINKELDDATKALDYGEAFEQIDQINLNCLHDLGFTGQGVYLAVIDAGFINMDNINYFDSVYIENRMTDSHDFVNNAGIYDYSGHGTLVSSCIVAQKGNPDKYIGTAKDVQLALYVSEDITSETEIEEFNLVAALERCDSVGIDVVNISLGYTDFDDVGTSHPYSDFDGETTIAAQGVNIAYTKGIIVAASAGNEGPSTIGTPCDADHCLCVGAVNEMGTVTNFSSIGPSADNQVKPDVAARGRDAWLIDTDGFLTQANGTSFSSPIMAGAIACLIQAHPTNMVDQIMDAVRMSASQFNSPDIFIGYGIPDFCVAHDILTNSASINDFSQSVFSVFPIPANESVTIRSELNGEIEVNIYQLNGLMVFSEKIMEGAGSTKVDLSKYASGVYTMELKSLNTGLSLVKQIVISK